MRPDHMGETALVDRFGRMISAGCRPVQWLLRVPYQGDWQRQFAINPSTVAFPGDVHVSQHETDAHERYHVSQPRQLSSMTVLAIADFARLHGLRVDIEVDQELATLLLVWSRSTAGKLQSATPA